MAPRNDCYDDTTELFELFIILTQGIVAIFVSKYLCP